MEKYGSTCINPYYKNGEKNGSGSHLPSNTIASSTQTSGVN